MLASLGGLALSAPVWPAMQSGVVVHESFDAPAQSVRIEGAARLGDSPAQGAALHVPDGGHARLTVSRGIASQGGSIAFWLRPLWREDDDRSHVLLTARWGDGKDGYLALSYGWWEPLGAKRLYFIVNNQQAMHCSTPFRFDQDVWVLVTASWSSGSSGRCAIYIDETRVAEHVGALTAGHRTTGPLYIGSDQGAIDRRGRAADFAMDELRIFDAPARDDAVRNLYRAVAAQPFRANRTDWDWMDAALARPATERRAADGVLLETRVLFDEDIHWAYSKRDADRILQRVKAAGFNVYVPCVWHGRGSHYPTALIDPDARIARAIALGYDPLAYLIERAHAMGIEVHPWFTVVRREWQRYPQYFPEGTPDGAYDVHNPEFRDFMVNMIVDVVARYDVDGINLDYIRAMGICTSRPCAQDYTKKTGHELGADYYLRFVAGAARDRIEAWQDAAVGAIVRRVATESRRLKHAIVISVDGHPKAPGEHRPLEGRDEIGWANKGWVDVIYAMDYRKRFDDAAVDSARAALHEPHRLIPLFGNFDRLRGRATPRAGTLIERYVQFTRRKWPDSGAAFYIYNMLSDAQLRALRSGAYREASRPLWPELHRQMISGASHRSVQ